MTLVLEGPVVKKRGRPVGSKNKTYKGTPVLVKPEPDIPVVETSETYEERVARIETRFDVMHKLAHGVVAGNVRAMIISGAGGVGKSYSLGKIMQMGKENYETKYEIVSGMVSPVNLFAKLYKMRDANSILVLDDADGVFEDDSAVAVLKAALDTSLVRKISWLTQSKMLKDEGIPNEFFYDGSIIFISNIDFDREVAFRQSKRNAHLKALLTRCIYLDLCLHTPLDLVSWVRHIVVKNNILIQLGCTPQEQTDVLDWMQENHKRLRNLSIRGAMDIGRAVLAEKEDWQKLARITQFKQEY